MADTSQTTKPRPHTDDINDAILLALARGEIPGCAEEEAEWIAQGRWPAPPPPRPAAQEDAGNEF